MAGSVSVEIVQVQTARQRHEFIRLPWPLYRNDDHWVPPLISDQDAFLDPRRGPFYEHGEAQLLLARRGGKAVGRISAHVNHLYDQMYQDGAGFFGFFECEDDQGTAHALLQAAEQILRGKKKRKMVGPMSFGVYDEIGIVVQGFDSDPYVMNSHNPPYYQRLLEREGFGKEIDWFAYRGYMANEDRVSQRLFKVRDQVLKRDEFHLRHIDLRQVDREAAVIDAVFRNAWAKNWGHVPWTEREFARLKQAVKQITIPELSFVGEVGGKPVGFALSIYDANQAVKKINGRLFPFGFITFLRQLKRTDRFRHILMGVHENYRNQGIEIAFYASITENARRMGFREVEMSLIVENNVSMRNSLKHFPLEAYKTYRIYSKKL
jgi:GNAT superfamily N-acetyltransferase